MSKNKNQGFEISDGYNLLMLRAEEGNFDEVQNLLSGLRQIDINSINKKGYTALAIAVKNGYLEIVRILLSKGASVNTKNNSGQTPLFLACWCNHVDIVRLILECGGEINTADQRGWSPLTIAAYHGNIEIVQILIQNNVDISIQDSFGKRAIHRAKDARIIKLLQAAEVKAGLITCTTPEKSARGSMIKVESTQPTQPNQAASVQDPRAFFNGPVTEPSLKPKRAVTSNHSNGGSPTEKNASVSRSVAWQSDSKVKKTNTSFDGNAIRAKSPVRRVTNPTDSKSVLDKLVNPQKQTLRRARSPDATRSLNIDQNVTLNNERKNLEEVMNVQLKNASEQIQMIIEQKVAVEVNRNIIDYQEKLKKGLENALNKKLVSSFQALQVSFNNQLRVMLTRLGVNLDQTDLLNLLTQEPFSPRDIALKSEGVKAQPIKEVKMVELNIQKIEKSLTNPKAFVTPPKFGKGGRDQDPKTPKRSNSGYTINVHRSDGKTQALDSLNKGVKATTGTLVGYSNAKINEAVVTGTKTLHDNLLAELGGNIDIAEEELRKKFEGLLANKFAQLSEIMANSSIHSEDIIEKTITDDSFIDRKSSSESKSILQNTIKALKESESGWESNQVSLASEVMKTSNNSNNFKVDKIKIPENTRFQNYRDKSEITRESLHSVEEEEDSGKEPLTGQDRLDSVKLNSDEKETPAAGNLSSRTQDELQVPVPKPMRLDVSRNDGNSLTNITPTQSDINGPVSSEYRFDGLKNFFGRKSAADSDGRLSKNSVSNRGAGPKNGPSHNQPAQQNVIIPSHNLALGGPKIGIIQYDFSND